VLGNRLASGADLIPGREAGAEFEESLSTALGQLVKDRPSSRIGQCFEEDLDSTPLLISRCRTVSEAKQMASAIDFVECHARYSFIALVVLSAWLPTPSLAAFSIGGAVVGACAGAIFKGSPGTVIAISEPADRA
jgi:hypothetical protein